MRQGSPTPAALAPCPHLTQLPSPPARMPIGLGSPSLWETQTPAQASPQSRFTPGTWRLGTQRLPCAAAFRCLRMCPRSGSPFVPNPTAPSAARTIWHSSKMATASGYHGNSQPLGWKPSTATMATAKGHYGNNQWPPWQQPMVTMARAPFPVSQDSIASSPTTLRGGHYPLSHLPKSPEPRA